jgi:hypothetical protein
MPIAMEMLLTGDGIDAVAAERWGLVNKVVPMADLLETAYAYARKIAANAPLAVQAAKELALRSRDMDLTSGLRLESVLNRMLMGTDDAKEGPAAFSAKRKPEFKGNAEHDRPAYPLQGITVVDLGQIYNGPYCTFLMAMAGARVIKIEAKGGENLRRRSVVGGAALPFAMLNSNKTFATLNLKTERGRELLRAMVKKGDVLVENFAPGAMERLGRGIRIAAQDQPAPGLRLGLRLRPLRPQHELPGHGPHGAGHRRHHERHRLPRPPTGQGRPGDVRLRRRRAPVRRHHDRAVRAREDRCRAPGRGVDAGGGLRVAEFQPRPALQHGQFGAAAHRQPPRRPGRGAVQRLSQLRRPHRDHLCQRGALEGAAQGHAARGTAHRRALCRPQAAASSTWTRWTHWWRRSRRGMPRRRCSIC